MGRFPFFFVILLIVSASGFGVKSASLCGAFTAWSGDPLFGELSPTEVSKIGELAGEDDFSLYLARALALGQWSHPLLDPKRSDVERVARAALGLYLKKTISVFQFATLLMRWQTQKDFGQFATADMETWTLSEGGHLTPAASLLLRNGKDTDRWSGALSEAQLAEFARAELPFFPLSERSFFVLRVAEKHFTDAAAPSPSNLSKVLTFITDTRIFYRSAKDWPGVLREGEVAVIVPSVSLLQARLKILYGPHHMQLQPLLGRSTSESVVEHAERGFRVFAVGFPTLPSPEFADEFTTHWTGFSWHDYFHAAEASKLDPLYRLVFLRVARLAHESKPRDPEAERLWRKAVDLDSNTWAGLEWGLAFQRDLGGANSLGSRILRSDLHKNSEWYRARGIDPTLIARHVPPPPRFSFPHLWPATP